MKAYFKKIDHHLLQKYPNLWVLGVHIYIPIILALYLIIGIAGLLYLLNPLPEFYRYRDFFENMSVTMILPTILLVVIFIIRQVKFNSKRVHLSLPYKQQFLVFLYFIFLFLSITTLPFVGNITAYIKTSIALDETQFSEDVKIMQRGFVHFYLEKSYVDDPEDCVEAEANGFYVDDYGDHRSYKRYELNDTKDSLIVYRHFVDYSYNNDLDTISLDQAYLEIDSFIALSHKYQGDVTMVDPLQIVNTNLKTDRFYTKFEKNVRPAFSYLQDYGAFDNNINFHNKVINKGSFFFPLEWDFWRGYMFVTLVLAILLIILCSVNIAEFGWGMLVVALHPTVFGIVAALVAFLFRDVDGEMASTLGMFLLLLFTANAYFFAFNKRFKPALRRAFAIACHIYTPVVACLLIVLFKEASDCCYLDASYRQNCDCFLPFTRNQYNLMTLYTLLFGALISTYFFGRYYKKQYVNPQIK